jgi:MSHA biogenesis protein MshJ
VLVFDSLLLLPQRSAVAALNAEIQGLTAESSSLQLQEVELTASFQTDPNQRLHDRQVVLQQDVKRISERLDADFQRFIAPEKMVEALRLLLRETNGVTLVSLQSLPIEKIVQPEVMTTETDADAGTALPDEEAAALPAIYKRKVELRLSGNYHGLVRYLDNLNRLPWVIGWEFVHVEAEAPGQDQFHLRLYTLTLEESWLRV